MKRNNLFEQYLIDINTLDDDPKSRVKRLNRSMFNNLDKLMIKSAGVCLGIITLKVMIEQLVMQLGVYLK